MQALISKLKSDPYEAVQSLSIPDLEKLVNHLRDKFFNDESVVSDEVYDLIIDFITYKDPKNKILKVVGAKVSSKDRVDLDYYLGSMDKIKPDGNKIEKWIQKYKSPYILTDKLDGVSALLVYKENGDKKLYTRGTATQGLDISHLLKYFNNIPSFEKVKEFSTNKKIKSIKKDNLLAFRGELIISKKEFDDNWKSKKSNARNTVSGLVNSKHVDPELAKATSLVIYEMVDPIFNLSKQLEYVKTLGFKTVSSKEMEEVDYEKLSKYLLKRKEKGDYVIDGIIVSSDKKHERNTTGNPDYAFAFKDILEDQKAITEILSLEWNTSKDGYINPIVIIKPVEIGGVTINRVTAYNAKYVVDNKIGKGAKIELIRSGDVIPKIIKVITPVTKVELPEGDWKWNETKVDIISNNLNSKDVTVRNNHYFFASLDTKGLGLKIVEKVYDSGIKTIVEILKAKESDFLKVEGFRDKSAKNLVEAIKKAMTNDDKGIEMYELMSASNKLGHGMGKERCKLVLENIPNLINDYKKFTKKQLIDKIKEIPSFEEKTSKLFVENLDKFIDFYKSIEKFVKIKSAKKKTIIKDSKVKGKLIVLSGFRDKELEKKLSELGVEVKSGVSKNIDILVVKDEATLEENTGKVSKAKDLNVNIMTKPQFMKLLD